MARKLEMIETKRVLLQLKNRKMVEEVDSNKRPVKVAPS